MKNILIIALVLGASLKSLSTVHTFQVWDGYFQFLQNTDTIFLGDTIDYVPLDQPSMAHTITSTNIPVGAASFDEPWQMPADTFFRYIPTVAGHYDYVCTPHISIGMVSWFYVVDSVNSVQEIDLEISVYPNPTSEYLFVDDLVGQNAYEIFNLQGQMVKRGVYKGQLYVGDLPNGSYTIVWKGDRVRKSSVLIE